MADKTAFLIGHPYFNGGDLMMVSYTNGLCTKQVTFLGTRHIHDTVADAECELSLAVHQGRYRQVGQRKQGPSLTDISTIQMFFCHQHFGYGMFCVHLCNPATSIGCEAIRTIQ